MILTALWREFNVQVGVIGENKDKSVVRQGRGGEMVDVAPLVSM